MLDRFLRSVAISAVVVLATFPVLAADYVQAPGSSLQFAGSYEGEPWSGHFPGST